MRDPTHSEQIERWARFVKNNPNKWKSELNKFIDAQIQMANDFYKKLSKTSKGREKIKKLRNI